MTNRTRVMMLVLFLVSFAAGVGAAMVSQSRSPVPPWCATATAARGTAPPRVA